MLRASAILVGCIRTQRTGSTDPERTSTEPSSARKESSEGLALGTPRHHAMGVRVGYRNRIQPPLTIFPSIRKKPPAQKGSNPPRL